MQATPIIATGEPPSQFLRLREYEPIASGALRYVFQHPHIPELLVKVIRPPAVEHYQRQQSWWQKPFRRYQHFSHLLREVREHFVSRLAVDQAPSLLQNLVGFVDTDYGLGTMVVAERSRHGGLAPTLQDLVESGLYDDQVAHNFEVFTQRFLNSKIIAMDLNPANLVYAFREDRGDYFSIIDGLGEKTLIPIHSLSPFFNRRCKQRRIDRLRAFIAAASPAKPRGNSQAA